MSLSIILTCYNEVPLIFDSYRTLSRLMEDSAIDHEFIVVDDGSSEDVQASLENYFGETDAAVVLSERNEGRGAAVTKGIRRATKEYACFIDTDLEVSADTLPLLYRSAVAASADMVVAERVYRWDPRPSHLVRNLVSKAVRAFSARMLGLGGLDIGGGAVAFRRSAVVEVLDGVFDSRWFWVTETIAEAVRRSQKVIQVPVAVNRRSDKSTSVRPLRDGLAYIRAVFEYRRRAAVRSHR